MQIKRVHGENYGVDNNALAESMIGLFKTELIRPRSPWRTVKGQLDLPAGGQEFSPLVAR